MAVLVERCSNNVTKRGSSASIDLLVLLISVLGIRIPDNVL